jgi:hypothetical protein
VRPMTVAAERPSRGIVIAVWLLALVGLLAAVVGVLPLLESSVPSGADALGSFAQIVVMAAFIVSGAVIASRQPRNSVGWLLMAPGLTGAVGQVVSEQLSALSPVPTSASPALWLALWFTSWSWLALIYPIFHLLLTFPSGQLLSPRWRWAVGLELTMVGVFVALVTFSTQLAFNGPDGNVAWEIPNPVGFIDPGVWNTGLGVLWEIGLLVLTIAGVAAMVLRFRRGTPEARHQLKWPMLAIAFFGVVYGFGASGSGFENALIWNLLFEAALASIPVSVALAVLKYRLFEIDRIISRTVSWAIITGLLVAVFAVLVVGLQALLSGLTQGETMAVAASTLVAFALFQPVRRRIQRLVDRRFDRSRYDAERTAVAFADRLRDEVDLDTVAADLTATARASFSPSSLSVWLRESAR